jgi:hypothetical protein
VPLEVALLRFTNLYARFGLGRDFDPLNATWAAYVAGLDDSSDREDWTFRFYRSRLPDAGPPSIAHTIGCFSYARLDSTRVRLHFHNVEHSGIAPLGRERLADRRAELRALMEQARKVEGSSVRVVGVSWMYNIDAYRRIFPPRYLATARVVAPPFQSMALWGQFLDRNGVLRDEVADAFLVEANKQATVGGLSRCLPNQVLALDDGVSSFA